MAHNVGTMLYMEPLNENIFIIYVKDFSAIL